MIGHGAKFGRKGEQAIAALLAHRNLEEAARAVGVGVSTLKRWVADPEFDAAYREARREAYLHSILLLADASRAAVTTVMKVMLDANAPAGVRLNAAEIVLERGAAAIAIEEISARVAELERTLSVKGSATVVLPKAKVLQGPEGDESRHG